MTVVLAWEPEFPPVSKIMGMKVTSNGIAEMASSNFPKIEPVIVPATMRMSSHRIRFLTMVNTPVFK